MHIFSLNSLMMTGKQRRTLCALAHSLKPLLQLGKHGLSDQFLEQLNTALLQHELIKLKVLENAPSTPRECAKILEQQPALEVIQVIGRTVILYRPHPEDPQIILPSSD
jgi:RNA-binding protein